MTVICTKRGKLFWLEEQNFKKASFFVKKALLTKANFSLLEKIFTKQRIEDLINFTNEFFWSTGRKHFLGCAKIYAC